MHYRSIPLDTSHLPNCFTRFPVRIHRDKDEIHRFTLDLVKATKRDGSKEQRIALYKHGMTGPDLNVYALLWCEANTDRMKLAIEFFELIWDHDDITEEHPLDEALSECERLRLAMHEEFDGEPVSDNEFGMRIIWLRDLRDRMKTLDSAGWLEIRDVAEAWILSETQLKEWGSLEEYLELRKTHVGIDINATVIRWMAGINLTTYELQLARPYVDALGIWLSLMNDYVSWKRESIQPTDRIMNSVHVVMKKSNISEEAAINLVRGVLVKQEGRVLGMGNDLRAKMGVSRELKAFIDNLEFFAGGGFYWSHLTPVYA